MGHIYLIGFMGSGKSTVGAALARAAGYTLFDTDELIISRDGRTIPDIFSESGEPFFRRIESEVISDIADMTESAVVSCGGGVVLAPTNVLAMKRSGRIIWLTASSGEILRRVSADESRPLLSGKKTIADIEKLMAARHERYEDAADVMVSTDGRSVDDIVGEILQL